MISKQVTFGARNLLEYTLIFSRSFEVQVQGISRKLNVHHIGGPDDDHTATLYPLPLHVNALFGNGNLKVLCFAEYALANFSFVLGGIRIESRLVLDRVLELIVLEIGR